MLIWRGLPAAFTQPVVIGFGTLGPQKQPAVARLEADDHTLTFSILEKLALGLVIEFHIEITPAASELRNIA